MTREDGFLFEFSFCTDQRVLTPFIIESLAEISGDSDVGIMFHDGKDWLKIESEGELLGCFSVVGFNGSYIEFHPFITKSRRNKSKNIIRAFIEFMWSNLDKRYKSLITKSPESYRHVSIMCAHFGFERIGTIKSGFIKDGKFDNVIIYQLMRI